MTSTAICGPATAGRQHDEHHHRGGDDAEGVGGAGGERPSPRRGRRRGASTATGSTWCPTGRASRRGGHGSAGDRPARGSIRRPASRRRRPPPAGSDPDGSLAGRSSPDGRDPDGRDPDGRDPDGRAREGRRSGRAWQHGCPTPPLRTLEPPQPRHMSRSVPFVPRIRRPAGPIFGMAGIEQGYLPTLGRGSHPPRRRRRSRAPRGGRRVALAQPRPGRSPPHRRLCRPGPGGRTADRPPLPLAGAARPRGGHRPCPHAGGGGGGRPHLRRRRPAPDGPDQDGRRRLRPQPSPAGGRTTPPRARPPWSAGSAIWAEPSAS